MYKGEKVPQVVRHIDNYCGTCMDRANAFAKNGVTDPALEVEN